MTFSNAITGMGTFGVTGLPQLTLKATNQVYTLSIPNGHLAIDGGRVNATGMNPTGTNMSLALNNGGALYTLSGITFGNNTSGGNTGLVTSSSAPGLGGIWDFGGNGLILASAFSANANNNNLTFNNVTITNLTSLGGGDTGTKMANTLILTNSARLYCTSINVASKGGYTNQFLVTGGSKLYVNGAITLAFNGTIANTLKVDGLGVPGGATIIQDGSSGGTVAGNWDGSTVLTNSLIVTNGGWFVHTNAAATLTIGYAGASGNVAGNALLVTGAGSVLNGGGNFILDIADGYSSSPAVGNYVSIANGGVATNIGNITVANGIANSPVAFGNMLIVTNGGRLYNSNVTIGNLAGHSNNQYVIDGSVTGSIVTNATIAVGGNAANNNSMTVANAALLSSTLTVGSAATNNSVVAYNGARWTLGNQSISIGAGVSSGNTLRVEAGALVTNVSTLTIGSTATSCGNGVTLNGGSLSAGGLTMNIGPNNAFAFNSGLLQLNTATVSNGLPFFVGDGGGSPAELNLTGGTNATQTLSFFNGLVITNNGILSGSGRVVSPTTIAGTLAPGGVGATTSIVFTSNLTLTATAVVKIDIVGKTAGSLADLINATGQTVDLGGSTLQVRLAPGYTPARTDVFTNLVAGALLNGFGNVVGGRVVLTQPAATMTVSTSGNRVMLGNYVLSLGTCVLFL